MNGKNNVYLDIISSKKNNKACCFILPVNF